MRVLTLEEMERVAGGGGKPKARARPHKSGTSSGHASSWSGSSGGTCAPPPPPPPLL